MTGERRIPPRQNIHFRDGVVLATNVTFAYALTELRRLGGQDYELTVARRRVSVADASGSLVAYAVPVDGAEFRTLSEATDALLRANGGDRPIAPNEADL